MSRFESLETRQLLAGDLIFADSFESGSHSTDWQGAWVASGGNDWIRSTQRATDGSWSAELNTPNGNPTLQSRQIDLSQHFDSKLTYSWYIEGNFDGTDSIRLELWDGDAWIEFSRLAGQRVGSEDVWHTQTIAIPNSYAREDFQFRFLGDTDRRNEEANVDGIEVTATPVNSGSVQVSVSGGQAVEGDGQVVLLDTFVPEGRAGFISPFNLSLSSDYLYIADGASDKVIRVDAATGTDGIAIVEGGSATQPGDGGLQEVYTTFVSPDGDLFVVDPIADQIFRFDGETGSPKGASGDADDALFVANGAGGLTGPFYLAMDADGDLYVSTPTQILKFAGPDNSQITPGSFIETFVEYEFVSGGQAMGLEFDANGNLYVANRAGDAVWRYDANGNPNPASGNTGAYFVTPGSGGLSEPWSLRLHDVDGGGKDLFVVSATGEVLRYDGATGQVLGTYATIPAEYTDVWDLEFQPNGNLLVAAYEDGRGDILRYGAAGQVAFEVTLSSPASGPVSVDVITQDGTAIAGVDYEGVSQTVVFAPGETSVNILAPTIDDAEMEANEVFDLALSNIAGADPGVTSATGLIIDNDQPNQAPTAQADNFSGFSEFESILNVLANDSDPEGDVLSVVSLSDPSHGGSVIINADNTLSYTSAAGFVGTETFDYTMSDGNGNTDTGTVSIAVSAASVTRVFVADISFQSRKGGKDWRVNVAIRDENNQPVQGVDVKLTFGGIDGVFTTDANGQIQTNWQRLATGTLAEIDTEAAPGEGFAWDQSLYDLFGLASGVGDEDGDSKPDRSN